MAEVKHREEDVYRAVELGLRIDSVGRVWRVMLRHGKPGGGTVYTPCAPRLAESDIVRYFMVRTVIDGVRYHALAHRLVWLHFFGPIPGDLTVNHKDGNGKNNRPENLELADASGQQLHALRVLGRVTNAGKRGEENHSAIFTEADVRAMRDRRDAGEPLRSIALDFNTSDQTVSLIALRKRWRHVA